MGDEKDRAALRARLAQRVKALALEGAVADREHLVDQQHVGVHVHHHGEGQAHLHARGVVLELQLGEALELGELDDRVVALARLRGREPEHHGVDQHVVARGEVGVEAHAQLDEGRDPAAGPDLAGVGPVDAGHALHERGLAAAVAADDPEELARAHVDRDPAQGLELLLRAGAERMQRTLLERVHLLVGKAEGLGDVTDRQRHACLGRGAHRPSVVTDSLRIRDAGAPANRPWRAAPGRQPRGLPRLDAGRRAGRPAGSRCARGRRGGRRPVHRRGRLRAPYRGRRARARRAAPCTR